MKKSVDKSNDYVNSIDEYIRVIVNKYSSFKPNAFYEKERSFFRGQNNTEYSLLPSLARTIVSNKDETYTRFEGQMINTAKLQNPDQLNNDIYPINMLAKMQHYGLPTRLLDITENALVALYFACKDNYRHDGIVYCFVVQQKEIHSAYSIYANMIANFYEFSSLTSITYEEFWDIIKYKSYIPGKEKDKDYSLIKNHLEEHLTKTLFVLPEMLTEREKRQQAAFIIFPNEQNNNVGFYNTIRECNQLIDNRIIVKKSAKRKILKQIALLGISEEFLFPEIDRKCVAIKEQTKNLIDEDLYYDYDDFREWLHLTFSGVSEVEHKKISFRRE